MDLNSFAFFFKIWQICSKRIGEKVSVLQKIESGKMTPDIRLAQKLEHALKVKLLVPPKGQELPPTSLAVPHEVTLGDVVQLKEK